VAIQVRRVVTGHDANGKAVVEIDEVSTDVISRRPGQSAAVIWTTQGWPVDNDCHEDGGKREVQGTLREGSVFRVIEYGPGVAPRNHRTDSIDCAAVLKGEIDMDIDGALVHLKQGDVLVQRGTIHNWINNGTEPCVIAFVLIDAKPVEAGGKRLTATG
jgi:quercetin dioxygenase-like cupin family protein